MKNYYYNPKTQDLMIFDTEQNEILTLEKIVGIRVITTSEIRNPGGEEPVNHWKNGAYDPETGKVRKGPSGKRRAAPKPLKKCGYCHSTEHRGKNCPNKPSTKKPKVKGTKVCNNCGEPGHMAKTCKNQPKAAAAPESSEKLPDEEIDKIAREERKEGSLPE
jgi:hypothetical protein